MLRTALPFDGDIGNHLLGALLRLLPLGGRLLIVRGVRYGLIDQWDASEHGKCGPGDGKWFDGVSRFRRMYYSRIV